MICYKAEGMALKKFGYKLPQSYKAVCCCLVSTCVLQMPFEKMVQRPFNQFVDKSVGVSHGEYAVLGAVCWHCATISCFKINQRSG